MKIPVYHNKGFIPCHKLAFYYKGEITVNTIISALDIELLDGTNPKSDEIMRCGNCKEIMHLNLDCLFEKT